MTPQPQPPSDVRRASRPCAQFQRWWLDASERERVELPLHQLAHVHECPACAALVGTYGSTLTAWGAATAVPTRPLPSFERIRGAALERGRTERRRERVTRVVLGVALPAAAAAAVVLVSLLDVEPLDVEPPGSVPSPVALQAADTAAVTADAPRAVMAMHAEAVEGTVSYLHPADPSLSVAEIGPHAGLAAGGVLDTSAAGAIVLGAVDVGRVEVAGGTRVRLDEITAARTRLTLEEGTVTSFVEPRAPGEVYEIRTPVARVWVIGTSFVTQHVPTQGTRIEGLTGRVRVETLDGTRLADVGPGDVLVVPVEGAIEVPVASVPLSEVEPLLGDAADGAQAALAEADAVPAGVDVASEKRAARKARVARKATAEAVASAPALATPEVVAPEVEAPAERKARVTREATAIATPEVEAPAEPVAAPEVRDYFREAEDALADGRDGDAIALLEQARALGQGPAHRVMTRLGDAHRLAGQPEAAVAAYRRALDRAGGRDMGGVVADLTGVLDRTLGQASQARELWESYVLTHPKGRKAGDAHAWLVARTAAAGDRAGAVAHWQALLEVAPKHRKAATALARLGKRLLAAGAWGEASALFGQYLDAGSRRVRETAFVGTIRVAAGQGQWATVRDLAAAYRSRFTNGSRSAEVDTLEAKANARD